ncbi:orotidine-5'-phosphate decarboxylase [uncultured Gemella sp.]|uniref:orotidine-5'-phosphate decarboxylase n=1 Tax=uncultured Gemella sp. TaxID=254352 RepID=UPI0025E0AAB3|nr:orotidine-5'-phosphate decarboxylase [uncultured Gemella sp.]
MNKDVIIALDFPTLEDTLNFLEKFGEEKLFVKVGMELYLQNGPVVIEKIKELGHKIFLDLKLHDIPNTVYGATKGLAKFKVDILTVHAAGGYEMLKAAKQGMVEGGSVDTNVIAITQLTSTSEEAMKDEQLIAVSLEESVINYAKLAKKAGLDGVVSSVWEARLIRENCGDDFLKVTPGIRLETDEVGDQKRVATPTVANEEGSTHIVVGRSITKSENPLEVYNLIKSQFVK